MTDGPSRPGGSWALQGCLFGAVGLFALLLIVMVVLAYLQMRENTAEPAAPSPADVGMVILPAEDLYSHLTWEGFSLPDPFPPYSWHA